MRLLLVSQLAPPSALIAARRVAGLTKYLARQGFEITVLTSRMSGAGPIEGAAEVVRTRDLLASPVNWRRRSLEVMSSGIPGTYRRPSRLQSVLVPDPALVSWLPLALPAAHRLGRFDVVLTTSPPQSAHVVGFALRRSGACWIAELRDGWTFEPPRPEWPLRTQRAFDRSLERRLLGAAHAVVAVTAPIAADASERLGVKAHVITNGFDPEDRVDSNGSGLLRPDRHSFVHTGRIGVTGTRLEPLLEALRLLGEQERGRLEIVFAGPLSEDEAGQLGAVPELGDSIRAVGSLERPRALRLQREADTLLVVTEGARRRSVATGKLFEYLAARRPVLVLGDETEAARIVRETEAGEAVPANDPQAIAAGLRRFASTPPAFGADVDAYSWERLGEIYAHVIEATCRG